MTRRGRSRLWARWGVLLALSGAGLAWWQHGAPAEDSVSDASSMSAAEVPLATPDRTPRGAPEVTPSSAVLVALSAHAADKPHVAERSAVQLQAEAKAAPLQADAQYRGQRLRVSGVLSGVESGAEGVWVMMLRAGEDGRTLRMVMAPGQGAVLAQKAQGDTVSVDCFDQGLVMGDLLLADCRLEAG